MSDERIPTAPDKVRLSFGLVLAVCCLLSGWWLQVPRKLWAAQAGASVSLLSRGLVNEGEAFDVTVSLQADIEIQDGTITLSFDPAQFNYDTSTVLAAGSVTVNQPEAGTLRIETANLPTGQYDLCRLAFTAAGSSGGRITVSDTLFMNDGQEMSSGAMDYTYVAVNQDQTLVTETAAAVTDPVPQRETETLPETVPQSDPVLSETVSEPAGEVSPADSNTSQPGTTAPETAGPETGSETDRTVTATASNPRTAETDGNQAQSESGTESSQNHAIIKSSLAQARILLVVLLLLLAALITVGIILIRYLLRRKK